MVDDQLKLAAWLDLFERLTSNPITHPIILPIQYLGQQIPKFGHYLARRESEAAELAKLSVDVATFAARRGDADLAKLLFLISSKFRVGGDGVAVFPNFVGNPIAVWAAIKSLAAADSSQDSGDDKKKKVARQKADERMLAELAADIHGVSGFTLRQWSAHTGIPRSTLSDCQTWKSLQLIRAAEKANRQLDRRGRHLSRQTPSGPDKTGK